MELLLDILTLLALLVFGGKTDRYLLALHSHGEHFILIIMGQPMNQTGTSLINFLFNSSLLSFLLNSFLDHIETAFLLTLRFLRLNFLGILIWDIDVASRS